MSRNIDVYVIPCSDLYVNLGRMHSLLGGTLDDTDDTKTRAEFLLRRCGVFAGEYYILVNNELFDLENPYWQLMRFMNAEFELPDDNDFYDLVLAGFTPTGITRVN